jgi:hypothetical protein
VDLDDPTAVALAAVSALERADLAHALYGGLLLAAYGVARETRDADLAVAGANAALVARAIATDEVATTLAFERVRFGGLWVSRITLLAKGGLAALNTVDLVEPRSPEYARRALGRSLGSTLRGQRLQLLSPEDFVVFKALSTREQDLIDAASVLRELGSELERASVEAELAGLAGTLADEPVAERWRRILALAEV